MIHVDRHVEAQSVAYHRDQVNRYAGGAHCRSLNSAERTRCESHRSILQGHAVVSEPDALGFESAPHGVVNETATARVALQKA